MMRMDDRMGQATSGLCDAEEVKALQLFIEVVRSAEPEKSDEVVHKEDEGKGKEEEEAGEEDPKVKENGREWA